MVALAPECRVSSMEHVVAFGHVTGSMRLRNVVAHGACLLCAIQQPPPPWVVWVGRRVSGSVSLGDGVRVDRVVVGFVSSVAEGLGECPLVREGRGFR